MTHLSPAVRPLVAGVAGAIAMAAAMGFGRFFYTPVLPGMMSGLSLSAADVGLIAAGNFTGYLLGAMLAAYGWAAGRERALALTALAATAVLLALMAATASITALILIRFLAGLASAYAMIFTSSLVLPLAAGRSVVQALHFGGVGAGIALSSLVAFLVNAVAGDAAHGWRWNWLAGAAIVAVCTAVIAQLLPRPEAGRSAPPEPPIAWSRPLVRLTASYGLFGFGYVITATFIVAMARLAGTGPVVEFAAWFITGTAAAVSLFAWRPVTARFGMGPAYLACLVLEALGIAASVALPPVAGTLVGGLFLGLTFMTVTAYGLQLARQLAPSSPRRALAFMTVAFGAGQIAGPLVAGLATEWSGSFTLASIIAAAVLLTSAVLVAPVSRFRPA